MSVKCEKIRELHEKSQLLFEIGVCMGPNATHSQASKIEKEFYCGLQWGYRHVFLLRREVAFLIKEHLNVEPATRVNMLISCWLENYYISCLLFFVIKKCPWSLEILCWGYKTYTLLKAKTYDREARHLNSFMKQQLISLGVNEIICEKIEWNLSLCYPRKQ